MRKVTKVLAALLVASMAFASHAADPAKKTYRLKFGHHNPPNAFVIADGTEVWARRVEARTNGQVKIDFYHSSTLGRAQDNYDAVKNGIIDLTWSFVAYYPGRFPLTEVLNLPMLGADKASIGTRVIWDLYQNTPYLKKEFADVKVLALHTHDGAPLTSRMPIKTVEDLAGKKIRMGGGPISAYLQSVGASPMAMPAPDTYQAAEKGVIDGAVLAWEAVEMINLQEVLKYAVDANLHLGTFFLVMNKQLFESMPPDIQKVFEEESGLELGLLLASTWDDTKKISTDKFLSRAGNEISVLPPEEAKRWQEKAVPVWNNWVADLEAKGHPAKAVLEHVVKKLKEIKIEK
jgi:TRAP-type C4-dicarboxylate transport system substrate-binding protein